MQAKVISLNPLFWDTACLSYGFPAASCPEQGTLDTKRRAALALSEHISNQGQSAASIWSHCHIAAPTIWLNRPLNEDASWVQHDPARNSSTTCVPWLTRVNPRRYQEQFNHHTTIVPLVSDLVPETSRHHMAACWPQTVTALFSQMLLMIAFVWYIAVNGADCGWQWRGFKSDSVPEPLGFPQNFHVFPFSSDRNLHVFPFSSPLKQLSFPFSSEAVKFPILIWLEAVKSPRCVIPASCQASKLTVTNHSSPVYAHSADAVWTVANQSTNDILSFINCFFHPIHWWKTQNHYLNLTDLPHTCPFDSIDRSFSNQSSHLVLRGADCSKHPLTLALLLELPLPLVLALHNQQSVSISARSLLRLRLHLQRPPLALVHAIHHQQSVLIAADLLLCLHSIALPRWISSCANFFTIWCSSILRDRLTNSLPLDRPGQNLLLVNIKILRS